MAALVDASRMAEAGPAGVGVPLVTAGRSSGPLASYYSKKIEEAEIVLRDRTQNLRRLEAQRNELNDKGAALARGTGRAAGRRARGGRQTIHFHMDPAATSRRRGKEKLPSSLHPPSRFP